MTSCLRWLNNLTYIQLKVLQKDAGMNGVTTFQHVHKTFTFSVLIKFSESPVHVQFYVVAMLLLTNDQTFCIFLTTIDYTPITYSGENNTTIDQPFHKKKLSMRTRCASQVFQCSQINVVQYK